MRSAPNRQRKDQDAYLFEKLRSTEKTQRREHDAEHDAKVLLKRLQASPSKGEDDFSTHKAFSCIKDFCLETTVNIRWYEKRRRRLRWIRFALLGVMALLPVLAGILLLEYGRNLPAEAGISLILGVVLPSLKLLGSAIDYKARFGAFWKATADLKELLFTIETAWKGKNIEEDTVQGKTFRQTLEAGRVAARRISREERNTFFQTYQSPGELISGLSGELNEFRSRMSTFLKERQAQDSAVRIVASTESPVPGEHPLHGHVGGADGDGPSRDDSVRSGYH